MRSQLFRIFGITGFAVLTLGLAAGALHQVPPALADSGDGWLGVRLQNLDSDLREALDLDRDLRGVLVSDVVSRSPADRAGIRRGDVITEIDDERVRRVRDVVEAVRDREPGDKVLVVVNRDGSSRGLSAVLGELDEADTWVEAPVDDEVRDHFEKDSRRQPRGVMERDQDDDDDPDVHVYRWHGDEDGDKPRVFRRQGDGDDDDDVVIELRDRKHDRKHMRIAPRVHARMSGGFLGVRTMELSDQLAEYFGTSEGEGVLVTEVVEDSPAEEAGIEAGDIILTVDGRDIEDSRDLLRAVRRMDPDESVEVEILRKGSRRTLDITLGNAEDFGSLAPEPPRAPRALFLPDIELPELHELDIELPDLEGILENLPEIEFDDGEVRLFINGVDEETAERVREELRDLRENKLEGLRESMHHLRDKLHRLHREARVKHEEARRFGREAVMLRHQGTI